MNLLLRKFQPVFKTSLMMTLVLFNSLLWASTEEEQAIQAPVQALHETLLTIMAEADTKDFHARYDMMEPVIVEHFNSPLIAKVILSRSWKSLDKKSQTDFIILFNQLTVSTYVDRFDAYAGERFDVMAVEKMKENRYMVKTQYIRTNDDPVSFNYIVQNEGNQWKIISVIANGINDLSLKRADYSAVIKNQGFPALINNLEQKIRDLQPK